MNARYLCQGLLSVILLLLFSLSVTRAQALKGRAVVQAPSSNAQTFEVPNLSGENLILVHFKGLVFLDNDEIAQVMGTETLHLSKGSGTYQGYEVLIFKDGSTIISRFEGTNRPAENGRYVEFEGSFHYTHGTGRFAGIKGNGTHKGRNYVASGAGGYYDFEGSYSLSSN
ncbi:MAG: hypothetical protein R3224_10590 [Balneolaceae bacterium]|nr:hypothetical protein [Balneolaceae bacterium]